MTTASMQTCSRFAMPERTPEEREALQREIEEREAEEAERERLLRAANAHIPKRYREARLAGFELINWVSEPTDGLVLVGSIGTGKTWTACAVLQACMERWNCSGKFVTAAEYVQLCREFEGQYIGEYFSCKVLVLDDLGKEAPTKFAIERIFDLIDKRHSTCRKTIITSNYSARSLMERMVTEDDDTVAAKAFMSRLSRFTFAPMSGIDKRKEGRSDGE